MVTAIPKNTPRIPVWPADTTMGRTDKGDAVARAVPFLASDAASLVNGAVLAVDDGFPVWLVGPSDWRAAAAAGLSAS